jgi:hypothetical protein
MLPNSVQALVPRVLSWHVLATKFEFRTMAKLTLSLANTTCRRRTEEEKDYRESVTLSVQAVPFAIRVVSLHFSGWPEFELCTFDMDRIAIEYLRLRGIKLPAVLKKLLDVQPPPRCTFILPVQHMSGENSKDDSNASSKPK